MILTHRAAEPAGGPGTVQVAVVSKRWCSLAAPTRGMGENGKASAGVVYYSAAVAAKDDLDIVRFPANVNLSDKIRNAASLPGTAKNEQDALDFVKFLLSAGGQNILKETGQPPVVPAIRKGNVPAVLK